MREGKTHAGAGCGPGGFARARSVHVGSGVGDEIPEIVADRQEDGYEAGSLAAVRPAAEPAGVGGEMRGETAGHRGASGLGEEGGCDAR